MDSTPKKQRVYLETSVISVLTARPSRDTAQIVRQAATEQWWREHRPQCDVLVSRVVDSEIAEGDADAKRRRQESVETLVRLPITDEANQLAARLLRAYALPDIAEDDALHIALAAVHKIDFLLTWNCGHIANGMMTPKILATITEAKYEPPRIMAPAILLESMGELP